jgi:hypothetical protein
MEMATALLAGLERDFANVYVSDVAIAESGGEELFALDGLLGHGNSEQRKVDGDRRDPTSQKRDVGHPNLG